MKNSQEELKNEFIKEFKDLLKEDFLKTIYEERMALAIKRQDEAKESLLNNSISDFSHPEMAETMLNDIAYSVLDLVIKGIL
jgi:hypothetical protein